jgi:hypothetical protein
MWFDRGSTAAVLAIELFAPFFIFGPRRLRHLMFVLLVGLQAGIALTGNYAFFNLLASSLCLFLLDDASLGLLRLSVIGDRGGPNTTHSSRSCNRDRGDHRPCLGRCAHGPRRDRSAPRLRRRAARQPHRAVAQRQRVRVVRGDDHDASRNHRRRIE